MNLRMKYKCLGCGRIVEFGPGTITLKCQACDGYDIAFFQDVLRTPVFAGERGEQEYVKKDQPVLGRHELGYIPNTWEVFPVTDEVTFEIEVEDDTKIKIESGIPTGEISKPVSKLKRPRRK